MSEGLSHGFYVVARVGFKPAIFRTEGTKHRHWATMLLTMIICFLCVGCLFYKSRTQAFTVCAVLLTVLVSKTKCKFLTEVQLWMCQFNARTLGGSLIIWVWWSLNYCWADKTNYLFMNSCLCTITQSINQSINQYRLMRLKIDLRSLLTQPQPGPYNGKDN